MERDWTKIVLECIIITSFLITQLMIYEMGYITGRCSKNQCREVIETLRENPELIDRILAGTRKTPSEIDLAAGPPPRKVESTQGE